MENLKRNPIIIIHGLFSPQITYKVYSVRLKKDGFKVYPVDLPFLNFCSIKKSAKLLDNKVKKLKMELNCEKIDIIGMSLGGIIGYYYVKIIDLGKNVSKMISIGGPLNGTKIAQTLSKIPILNFFPAIKEISPKSDIIKELKSRPLPEGVKIISIGSKDDLLVPKEAYLVEGIKVIHSPYKFPSLSIFKHHMLYLYRGNYEILKNTLLDDKYTI